MKFYLRHLTFEKYPPFDPETAAADSPEEALKIIDPVFQDSKTSYFIKYRHIKEQVSIVPNWTLNELLGWAEGLPPKAPNTNVYLVSAEDHKTRYLMYRIE